MNDSTAPIQDVRPAPRLPVRALVLMMVCWGGAFLFLDSWVECRALPGLSVPETASLIGALGIGGMMAVVIAFADDRIGGRSSSGLDGRTEHASSVDELSKGAVSVGRHRHRAFALASLVVLIVLSWHGSMREYDRALSRIEAGECAAHRQG